MTEHLKGKKALITGASSGFGIDFANIFAEMGMDLVLVARRKERLEEVKKNIEEKWGVAAKVLPMDLTGFDAASKLHELVKEEDIEVLINNAGYGIFGAALEQDAKEIDAMIQLNVVSLAALTNMFLKKMVAKDSGYIMNVSSFAGFNPMPLYAAYGATKSFVMNYTVAVHTELQKTGSKVIVSAFCPGYTNTEFIDVSRQEKSKFVKMAMGESYPAAKEAVEKMLNGKPVSMPRFINKFGAVLMKFMSRKRAAINVYDTIKK
jgi:uncharacterized protein